MLEHLLCVQPCEQHLTNTVSFNFQKRTGFCSQFADEKTDSERLCHLPKVTQLLTYWSWTLSDLISKSRLFLGLKLFGEEVVVGRICHSPE